MGYTQAQEMAEMLSIEDALAWHLRSNHYPPIPLSMVKPCMEAIDAMLEDEPYRVIDLPEGVTYKGDECAPAWIISDQHHLDAWWSQDEEGLE